MSWQWPAGAACGFLIALITTPAGVSGAVLLLPVQLSVLRVPSPAVTPTNLMFSVVAVPGSLLRFWHERRLFSSLGALLIAGTLLGVILGAIIRVEYLSGGRAFMFIAAGVLLTAAVLRVLSGREQIRRKSGAAALISGSPKTSCRQLGERSRRGRRRVTRTSIVGIAASPRPKVKTQRLDFPRFRGHFDLPRARPRFSQTPCANSHRP